MSIEELYVQHVAPLPIEEQRKLVERIQDGLRTVGENFPRRRFWREIRGIVKHPMCGEDAQVWVSRSRNEDQEHRDRVLRGEV